MKNRLSNFDLLKIICMLLIILGHVITYPNLISNTSGYISNILEVTFFALCVHVNIFILITGYFQVDKEFRWKKVFSLLFKVVFYNIFISLILYLFSPFDISLKELLIELIPFNLDSYWFIGSYILLYLLSPYLNIIINKSSSKELKRYILILLLIFSLIPCLSLNLFFKNNGYTLYQFILMYSIGAYIKKENIVDKIKEIKFKRLKLIAVFLISLLINYSIFKIISWLKIENNNFLFNTLYEIINKHKFDYSNIFLIIQSISLFLLFSTFNIKNKAFSFLSSSTLAVYIIHENPFMRKYIYDLFGFNSSYKYYSHPRVFLDIIVLVILILFISVLIDKTLDYTLKYIKEKRVNMKLKIEKNKILMSVLSIFLVVFSISGVLFKNSALEKVNLVINIEKNIEEKSVLINEILINDNSYKTKDILNYDEEKVAYVLNDEKLEYEITKNDNFYIEIEDENIESIEVIYNNKKLDLKQNNGLFTLEHISNPYQILKEEIKDTNFIYLFSLMFVFGVIYYLLINMLVTFIHNLYNKKVKVYEIFLVLSALFFIYYFNFYPLIILTKSISMLLLFIFLFIVIYKNRKFKFFNLENNFLFISIFLGVTFVFSIPPFYVLDEDNHYIKVYDHLFYLEEDKAIDNGVYISNNVYEFRNKYQNNKFVSGQKINALAYYDEINSKIDYKDLNENIVKYGTHGAKKLAYMPANIISFICKKLNTNVLLAFLLARFINLSLALIICYKAIKLIPKFKPLLFVIMTFGMTYQSIIGINQDWLNTSTCFLMIAYIMHLIFEKEYIEKIDYIVLGILSYVLAFSKTVYTPLILLVLFIDNKKFKNSIKHPFINKVLMIMFACSMTLLSYFWDTIFKVNMSSGASSNNLYSFTELLMEPIKLISIYFNTIKLRITEDIFNGYFNGYGWYIIWHNPIIFKFLQLIYLVILFTLPKEKIKGEKWLKALSLFIFVSMYGIICASMLFGWTKRGSTFIDGLQPRYFVPIIFCLYLVFNNNLLKTNKIKNYNLYLILAITFTSFLSLFTIIYSLF